MTEQLCFEFAEYASAVIKAELRREAPPGAERLLGALVKRGLHEGDLRVAAALCLLMDETASP